MSTAAPQPMPFITRQEYLAREVLSEIRHEYYRGQMYAMSGGSARHSRLKIRVTTLLEQQLSGRDCTVFDSDMRVLIESVEMYTYPDLSLTCSQPRFETAQETSLLNPRVIIEVLSPFTERYDRGNKFAFYREIPTLMRYLLVAQDQPRVEVFTRQEEGLWSIGSVCGLEASVNLPEIHATLPLKEIYAGIEFESAERAAERYESHPERRPGDHWSDAESN